MEPVKSNADYKSRLACAVVKEHFGDLVEKVCSVLIYKGRQSTLEIMKKYSITL